MSYEDEIKRILEAAEHIHHAANMVEAKALAEKMSLAIAGCATQVPAATGAMAVLLAACSILHLSMQQFREKHECSLDTVHAVYGAYQVLFGQFMAQFGEHIEETAGGKTLNTADVLSSVEALLGITKEER